MANINLQPDEALVLFEAANIALHNKQMFEHIAEEMDIDEEYLQKLADKLNRQLYL